MTTSASQFPPAAPVSSVREGNRAPSMLPIITFVLWTFTLFVGSIGLRLGYPPPQAPAPPALPVQTNLVNVEVLQTPPPPRETEPPLPNPSPLAALPDIPAVPTAPAIPEAPPVAVAQPSPAIAFALPVEGFTKIVDVNQAAHARPAVTGHGSGPGTSATPPLPGPPTNASPAPADPPAITHLTLGEGEGNQPAPDYPHDAVVGRQEGTVTLRFNVDETGRVTKVEVTTPSRWPLLNKAATNTVKEHWHFPPGQPRTYEVPIQFQLNQE